MRTLFHTTFRGVRGLALGLLLTLALGGAAYAITTTTTTSGYTITPAVTTATISPGGAVGYALNLQATGGFSDNVTLSATGVPAGATASFGTNPAFVDAALASGSTLWINTDSSIQPGTYTITINGASSLTAGPTQQNPTTVTLKVAQGGSADYTIQMTPTTQYVSAGGSVTYNFKVIPVNGFTGSVTLSASTVPGAVSLGWNGSPPTTAQNPSVSVPAGGSASLTVATTGTNPPGSYAVNVTGTGGGITHTIAGTLDIDLFSATGSTPYLYPGAVARPITVNLRNPYSYGVTVTGLAVSVASDSNGNALDSSSGVAIPGCLASWFQATDTSLSSNNTFSLSGGSTQTLPSADLPLIKMLNLPTNQDACKGYSLKLNFVGSAQK